MSQQRIWDHPFRTTAFAIVSYSATRAGNAYVWQGTVAAIVNITLNATSSGVYLFVLETDTGVVLKIKSTAAVVA